jgi:hypothetical protein
MSHEKRSLRTTSLEFMGSLLVAEFDKQITLQRDNQTNKHTCF